jgi:hypothetical protein
MKVTFEIDIVDEETQLEANRVLKAKDMALALFDIAYNIQKKVEWECEALGSSLDNDPVDGATIFREHIGEVFEKYGINIDDLIQ